LRIRIVRRLTLEEVLERLKEYERKMRMPFVEFERRLIDREIDAGLFGEYMEWASLVHAYEAYVEGGELDCVADENPELSPNEVRRAFTYKRLELLEALSSRRFDSINDVARRLNRNVKNVYQDLKALERLSFVRLRRTGKRQVVPEGLVDEITFITR
jgi:predicted transcriptional regulator